MPTKFNVDVVPPPSGPICDFCSSEHVFASYPAKTFCHQEVNGVHINSMDGWAACKTCSEFIEAERWDALLDRSVAQFKAIYGFMPSQLRTEIKLLHKQFRDNRTAIQ